MNTPQGGEFARGWKLLLSATLGVGLGLSPLPFYTSGVFVAPLSHAFGWTTAQVLSALIGTTLGAAAAAPFAGYAADRFGVRRIALTSCTLYALSWLLLTFTNGSLLVFDASWAVVGIVGTGTLPLTWTRPVSSQFVVNRGLALGIALFATGLFGALVKLYAGFLIGHFGWRAAYAGIGLLPLCISLPVAICFFHDDAAPQMPELRRETAGISLRGALADRRFWTLGITLICSAFALGGPIPNLERLLGTHGFAPATAVLLASFIGYGVVVGRIGGGWLLDRVWAPLVGFVLLAAPAVGLLALASTQTVAFAPAAGSIFLLGISVGSEYDLIAYMTARYFGIRSYSAIYGVLYGFFTLGSGFAPSIFGHSFDVSGTYAHVLHAAAGLTFLGALLLLTLGRYPNTS
jgi:predicted MFS family arabinose efflux permease